MPQKALNVLFTQKLQIKLKHAEVMEFEKATLMAYIKQLNETVD